MLSINRFVTYNYTKTNVLKSVNGVLAADEYYIYKKPTDTTPEIKNFNSAKISMSPICSCNVVTINFTTKTGLNIYDIRITKASEEAGVGIGTRAYYQVNIPSNSTIEAKITANTTLFAYGDINYRVSLYAQNNAGEWDAYDLFMCLDSGNNIIQFNPSDDSSGMQVISTLMSESEEKTSSMSEEKTYSNITTTKYGSNAKLPEGLYDDIIFQGILNTNFSTKVN